MTVRLFHFNSVLKQDDEGLVDDYNNYSDDYNNNYYNDDDGKTLSGASVSFEQHAEATWTKRRGGRGAGEAAVG